MKKVFYFILFVTITSFGISKEISLFDKDGDAVAYIDTKDENTIFTWDGEPSAYVKGGSVWGFNGNHLGWFEDGIIFDDKGNAVGCIKGTISMTYSIEGIKGIKGIKPIKGIREIKPIKPLFSKRWSRMPLSFHLSTGKD